MTVNKTEKEIPFKSTPLQCLIELIIEEAIQEQFKETPLRDGDLCNIMRKEAPNPWCIQRGLSNFPALLLVGFYYQFGGCHDDLAAELMLLNFRNRPKNSVYPTIEGLYERYKSLLTESTIDGEIFRKHHSEIAARIDKKIQEFK